MLQWKGAVRHPSVWVLLAHRDEAALLYISILVILQKRQTWEPEVRARTINRSLWYVLMDQWTLLTLNGAWRHSSPHHRYLVRWPAETVPWRAGTAKFALLILICQPEFACYDHRLEQTLKDGSLTAFHCSVLLLTISNLPFPKCTAGWTWIIPSCKCNHRWTQ